MKQRRKATAAAIAGMAGLVMAGAQSFASSDQGTVDANYNARLAHMSQGGGTNMPMRGGGHRRMPPGGGMDQGMMMPGGGPNQGMMGRGMMGQGMMGSGSMMGRGMMPGRGSDHGFGKPITPMMHLSVEDVRHALEHRLELRGNKRLKVGNVKVDGEDAIIAEIVTVDDSLVRRLKVDRHTGRMQHAE